MYGSTGLQAFKEYVSNHPEEYTSYKEVEKDIVDTSKSDNQISETNEIKSETNMILDSSIENGFNSETFYENVEKLMEEREKEKGD